MIKDYCIANWKMNQSNADCENFSQFLNSHFKAHSSKMIICPPSIHLKTMNEFCSGLEVEIGAQNVSENSNGAFTGEISCEMLLDNNVNWTILGHSERRQFFHETNVVVHNKLKNAEKNVINPILCIGESLEERKSGKTVDILIEQIKIACKDIDFSKVELVIAYEPVWAIGTGVAADLNTINETHNQIREFLSEYVSNSDKIPLLYGGSVNSENCKDILNIENVNGFLIGGASLDPQKFVNIYTQMNEIGVESL